MLCQTATSNGYRGDGLTGAVSLSLLQVEGAAMKWVYLEKMMPTETKVLCGPASFNLALVGWGLIPMQKYVASPKCLGIICSGALWFIVCRRRQDRRNIASLALALSTAPDEVPLWIGYM